MRAVLCTGFGEPLSSQDVEPPVAGRAEVLIDVSHAGVNFADSLLVAGLYQARPPLPFSPGFEASGRVAALGEDVSTVDVGDRVMATFEFGGYAEQVVAAAQAVVPLPDTVPFETAAGFPITYGTAYHALVDRAGLQPGETLLVTGAAGGVGLAAVQIGRHIGATVLAATGSFPKVELAVEHGASAGIDYSKENIRDRVRELTEGGGVDVVFDPVGGDVFDQCLRSLAWGGRLLVVGFTSGRIPEIPANLVLLKGTSVVGVFWGSFSSRDPEASRANFDRLLEWLTDGAIRPQITAAYPLDRAAEAMAAVAERRTTGKVILAV